MQSKLSFIVIVIVFSLFSGYKLNAQTNLEKYKFYYDLRVGLGACNIKGDFPEKMIPAMNVKLSFVPMVRVFNNLIVESDLGVTSFSNAYKKDNLRLYKAQYFQVSITFRSFFHKKYSVALGGTCNVLTKAVEYVNNADTKTVKINSQMKKIFPSATAGIQYGNNGAYFGFVYDYGLGSIHKENISWKASSFRLYFQWNFSERF